MRPALKKLTLLGGISAMSLSGIGLVNSLDVGLLVKAYGLLFTIQICFALFFLSRVRFRRDPP